MARPAPVGQAYRLREQLRRTRLLFGIHQGLYCRNERSGPARDRSDFSKGDLRVIGRHHSLALRTRAASIPTARVMRSGGLGGTCDQKPLTACSTDDR